MLAECISEGIMEPKVISKTNAVLQIVGIFFAIAAINYLIGVLVNGNGSGSSIGVLGLAIWAYLSYVVWIHTDAERLKKWREKSWWRR
jgi:hypothetical protein